VQHEGFGSAVTKEFHHHCLNECVCCVYIQQVVDVVHHWDAMVALVRRRADWVMANVPSSVRGWNVLAAFIVKRSTY